MSIKIGSPSRSLSSPNPLNVSVTPPKRIKGKFLGHYYAFCKVGLEHITNRYVEGEKKPVDISKVFFHASSTSKYPSNINFYSPLFGFDGGYVSKNVSTTQSSDSLIPLFRIPFEIKKEITSSMSLQERLESISKGRGYIQRDPNLTFNDRLHRRTRALREVHTKGTGATGWIEWNHRDMMMPKDMVIGGMDSSSLIVEIAGEALAAQAGMIIPRTVACCEWENFYINDICKPVSDIHVEGKSKEYETRLFALSRGWEDGHRIFELTYPPYIWYGYGLSPCQDLPNMSMVMQSYFSFYRKNEISLYANQIVNEYLDWAGDVQKSGNTITGIGAGFKLTAEDLREDNFRRIANYLDAFKTTQLISLARAANASIVFAPYIFHTENNSISGEVTGFDRILGVSKYKKEVRAGIVGGFVSLFCSYNLLATSLGYRPDTLHEYFERFQEILHHECSPRIVPFFSATTFEGLVDKGISREKGWVERMKKREYDQTYPFSYRFNGDVEIFTASLDRWFNIQHAIFSGDFKSDDVLRECLYNDLPRFILDPLAQVCGGRYKYTSPLMQRRAGYQAVALENFYRKNQSDRKTHAHCPNLFL